MSSDDHLLKAGRRAVRQRLIEPLQAEGMKRPRGESLDAEKEFLNKVVDRLSYMRADMLDRLLPIIREAASGKNKNCWPDLIVFTNMARHIQAPPDKSDEILYSWLHSRAGAHARDAGTLMATRKFIKNHRKPPADRGGANYYSGEVLPRMQREIDETVEYLRRQKASGEAVQAEIDRLAFHDEVLAGLETIVQAGVDYRRALKEGEAA